MIHGRAAGDSYLLIDGDRYQTVVVDRNALGIACQRMFHHTNWIRGIGKAHDIHFVVTTNDKRGVGGCVIGRDFRSRQIELSDKGVFKVDSHVFSVEFVMLLRS